MYSVPLMKRLGRNDLTQRRPKSFAGWARQISSRCVYGGIEVTEARGPMPDRESDPTAYLKACVATALSPADSCEMSHNIDSINMFSGSST